LPSHEGEGRSLNPISMGWLVEAEATTP